MTLVFSNKQKHPMLPKQGLTVPDEAFRGLSWENSHCDLYISDPRAMAVGQFRLSKALLAESKEEGIELPKDGEAMVKWLFRKDHIEVESIQCEGQPSMFPFPLTSGPRPSLPIPPPSIDR